MDIASALTLAGQNWTYGAGVAGAPEWFDPENPGAPGNFLQRGKAELPLDQVRLVVLDGATPVINAPMVRELDSESQPTGKWVLRPGDPGHVAVGNGRSLVATAYAVNGTLAVDEKTELIST